MTTYRCRVYIEDFDPTSSDWDLVPHVDVKLGYREIDFPGRVPCLGEEFRFRGYCYEIIRIIWLPDDTPGIVAQLWASQSRAD